MSALNEHLSGILATLPAKPGCYLMKDAAGQIIYVGKAISLKNRVRSYFHGTEQFGKTHRLVEHIADIEWIVVDSELEALILEMTLIKQHLPQFNVRLKDDKRYPFIKVNWADDFPKVTVTRRQEDDGARYYGPYTSVWAVHQTLDLLRKIFQFRSCDRIITGQDARACLYYDIKLCTAPCIGRIDRAGYRQMMDDLCRFLEGRVDPVLERLKGEMERDAQSMQYERAARARDQMRAIQQVVEKQKVISTRDLNSDVIALARSNGDACVQVFFVRGGRLTGREYFILEGAEEERDAEVISQFIKQFYAEAASIPQEVLLPEHVEESVLIQQWLNTQNKGERVTLKVPRRGEPRDLVKLASQNAVETLRALKAQWQADTNKQGEALAALQAALGLAQPPNRIECYDISNTQGTAAVGSMVVFEQGVPAKKLYRRFNIKSVEGPDDFASMQEVLTRRFKRWQVAQQPAEVGAKKDPSFALLPDLLLVDGGKGQLGRAVLAAEQAGLSGRFALAGLAKEEELLFVPGREAPIALPRNSPGLYLLQRVRDEAHRFAITAHRATRARRALVSALDAVEGIGPKRRKALLKAFGSVDGIKDASLEALAGVPGVTRELAERIKRDLI